MSKKKTQTPSTALAVRRTPAAKAIGSYNPGDAWINGLDPMASSYRFPDSPAGWIQAARANVWARKCIRARSNAFAGVPLKLYRRPDDPDKEPEEVAEHEVLTLLEEVNPVYLDRASFREQVQKQRCINGEAYIQIVEAGGKPAELYVLPAHLVKPIPDPMTLVAGFEFNGSQFIPRERIIRWYYMDSSDPLKAESPTSVAVRAINRYNILDTAAEAIDIRGGRGGGIIAANIPIQNDDGARLIREWNELNADPNRAGEDRFLPSGTEYKSGTLTAQQQQREERARRHRGEIFAAYDVPPAKAGDYSDASILANADQQEGDFWAGVMTYELTSFADCLTYYLLWRYWPEARDAGLYLAHDLSEVAALQPDHKAEAEVVDYKVKTAVMAVTGGVWGLDEARDYTGREPTGHPAAKNPAAIDEAEAAKVQADAEAAANAANASPEGDDAGGVDTQTANLALTIATAVTAGEITEDAGAALLGLLMPDIDPRAVKMIITPPEPEEPAAGEVDPLTGEPVDGGDEEPDPETDAVMTEVDDLLAEAAGIEDEPGEEDDAEEDEEDDAEAVKADYGAGAGETIAGNLARGGGGKFTAAGDAAPTAPEAPAEGKPKGKRKKKTDEEKAAEKKAKREAKAQALEAKGAELEKALEGLKKKKGKAAADLRKKIKKALARIEKRVAKLRNPERTAEDDLIAEAASVKAEPRVYSFIAGPTAGVKASRVWTFEEIRQ